MSAEVITNMLAEVVPQLHWSSWSAGQEQEGKKLS